MRLGTALMQLSARTPTAAAMAALTMDLLSDGRFVMGLGVSGPQVVEGWYGQPFPKPLARTREYVTIVRDVLAREAPVTSPGPHYPLPLPGSTDLGKPLKAITHPLRADLPIILGAEGPKNIALAAEIADGWLPIFYAPKHEAMYRESLAEGFARPGARRSFADFEVLAGCPVILTDDVEGAADFIRPMIALYIGGMGAREVNFHARVYERMGYEAEVAKIQDLYLAGHKDEATAAVPTRLIEETALIGPKAKLRDELAAWTDSFVTSLLVPPDIETMRVMTELLS
jgi:F420-dependent oxidoreductase-like protein